MIESKKPARWAGVLLLGSFGALLLSLSALPSFDARPEFFPEWFGVLVVERREFATAMVWITLTGFLAILADIALFVALRRSESPSAGLALLLAAIIVDGQLPYVWLSVGLPVAISSVGLGLYLALTGRVLNSS